MKRQSGKNWGDGNSRGERRAKAGVGASDVPFWGCSSDMREG